jgi:hypothetical protein
VSFIHWTTQEALLNKTKESPKRKKMIFELIFKQKTLYFYNYHKKMFTTDKKNQNNHKQHQPYLEKTAQKSTTLVRKETHKYNFLFLKKNVWTFYLNFYLH